MNPNNFDTVTSAAKIEIKIAELECERGKINDFAMEKADGISQYDRHIAITILKLKEGIITEFEGVPIKALQATLIPKIAQGICFNECYAKEAKDGLYRGLISNIDAIKAELNGLQSINRHLE